MNAIASPLMIGTPCRSGGMELITNTIPNSGMVSAGVLAVNRAQEYGYTLLTALSDTPPGNASFASRISIR